MADVTQKNKSRNIDAVMNNKNLNEVISTGLNSPLNSTNRDKAASTIKSLDVASGISPQVGIEGSQPGIGVEGVSADISAPLQPDTTTQGGQQDVGIGTPSIGMQDTTQEGEGQKEKTSAYDVLDIEPPDIYSGLSGQEEEKQKEEEQQQEGKIEIFPSATDEQETVPSSTAKRVLQQQGIDVSGLADDMTKKEYYDQWYKNLSDEEKKKFKPLYKSVKSGVGASTFADQMLRDKEKLKQMMPDVPDDALPAGASLVEQVDELRKTLKEEHDINELEQGLQQLQERGMTVRDDLEGYITARDEQIEKVDNLIDKAKNRMANMSNLANPNVAERMSNYTNYLYTLKGRQQKRYADFLDSGVNYYNQKLKRAQNEYKNAFSNFESELKNRKALLEEEHKRHKSMLEDMYKNVEEQAQTRSNKLDNQLKKIKNEFNLAKDIIELRETLSTLKSGGGLKNDFWESATNTQRNSAYSAFAKTYKRRNANVDSGDALRAWNNLKDYEKAEYIGYNPDNTDLLLEKMPGMSSEEKDEEESGGVLEERTSGNNQQNTSTSSLEFMYDENL